MKRGYLPVMLALLVLLSGLPPSDSQPVHHVCYVKPQNSTQPCPDPCFTLEEYAHHVISNCTFDQKNATFLFLHGVHELTDNITIGVVHTDSVSLLGNYTVENSSAPEILCYNEAGFLFKNSSNIVIQHLTFTGCGHWFPFLVLGGQATLGFHNVTNVSVSDTVVRNSTGYGLYALCAMEDVEIAHSVFTFNKGTVDYDGGNVGFLYQNCTDIGKSSLLMIHSTQFLYGYSDHINPLATGLSIFLWSSDVNVDIHNITAVGNSGGHRATGGNVALLLRNRTRIISNWIEVRNSYIANGNAYFGAGMFVSILDTPAFNGRPTRVTTPSNNTPAMVPETITIASTTFVNNSAQWIGGGLYVMTHEEDGVFSLISNVTVLNCVFHNNSLNNKGCGGVAVHLTNHHVLSYLNHSVPQFHTSLVNCTIQNSILLVENSFGSSLTGSSAVVIIQNTAGVLFQDCHFLDNNCTAMSAVWSSVKFEGNVTFSNNEGSDGGGIILCDNSYMLLRANTTVVFSGNRARHAGGGIYAENACLQSEPPCFFQLDLEVYKNPNLLDTVHIQMINNTAHYAGSAIYGGSVGYCYMFPQFLPDLKPTGSAMFEKIFEINHSSTDLSPISSNPYRVCFCEHKTSHFPNCGIFSIQKNTFPGQELTFFALTVGQKNGSAAGTVIANLQYDDSTFGTLENSQLVKQNCTQLHYTVFSKHSSEVITLVVQHSDLNTGAQSIPSVQVNVTLKHCPLGFSITDEAPYQCSCVDTLLAHRIVCNITNQTIHRVAPNWIGYHHQTNSNKTSKMADGIVFHQYCPLDYCKPSSVNIKTGPNVSDFCGDEQCAFHRKGILCGSCQDGYSLILGSSECRKCSNAYISLLAVFILAGLALVLLLVVFNLNVSSGTLSGVIFYVNIVQANRAIFFNVSSVPIPLYLCSIFIAWLNLDFGIETCFYNGMDAYAKMWLQFAFPLYVWGITGIIILLSRKYPSIAGRNPVKVLASLFLLSYAKLLRTIIASLSPANLVLPTTDNGTLEKAVWLLDGNVEYLEGKHIPLFVVALGFGLVTLPYVVVLFLIQWLQRGSSKCLCSWVVRLKPLFDAYTGPYKKNCRFWTGFLLLVRVGLFVAFAFPSIDPDLKLTVILSTCIAIQMIAWSFRGVYENSANNDLNLVFLLNLSFLSIATIYVINKGGSQTLVTCISISVTFVMFCGIIIHYIVGKRCVTLCKRLKLKLGYNISTMPRRNNGELEHEIGVTHTSIDIFNVEYREALITSGGRSYGTVDAID